MRSSPPLRHSRRGARPDAPEGMHRSSLRGTTAHPWGRCIVPPKAMRRFPLRPTGAPPYALPRLIRRRRHASSRSRPSRARVGCISITFIFFSYKGCGGKVLFFFNRAHQLFERAGVLRHTMTGCTRHRTHHMRMKKGKLQLTMEVERILDLLYNTCH